MYEPNPSLFRNSSSCVPNLYTSHRRPAGFARAFADDENSSVDDDGESTYGYHAAIKSSCTKLVWLWRRIVKERKRMLSCYTSTAQVPHYDPYTYAQNFDEGSAWVEPENLSRSFSARFATPSKVFRRFAT